MPWNLPGRYTPTKKSFGDGGMGTAVICKDGHLERLVLVKALQEGVDQKRITDELRALAEIRSKHVVQIYDVIKDANGKAKAIVEELLEGNDLMESAAPKNANEFFRVALQIASGIADIHEHGRVHRDIKPNNMKFDSEQVLKIFDFGLSRLHGVDSSTMAKIGTLGFMAPELFFATKGGTVHFSKAVDTFAFASTVYFLVARTIPKCLQKFPPVLPCADADFATLPFKLPDEVVEVLNSCFSAEPDNRPEMSHVRDVIAKYLLTDTHRAQLVVNNTLHTLSSASRVVNITAGQSRGSCRITYDGNSFVLSNVGGYVSMNNMPVKDGMMLVDSCVLCFGSPDLGSGRLSIPIDVSHPEVNA